MAVESEVIRRIRRKIFDFGDGTPATQTYDDFWYQDAIAWALSRFGTDIGTYTPLISITAQYEWAIILLGAIYMCGIRQTETSTTLSTNQAQSGPVRRTETEGLEVEFFDAGFTTTKDWNKYCNDLWDMYKTWLDSFDLRDTSLVTNGTLLTTDPLNCWGLKHKNVDPGIDTSNYTLTAELYGDDNDLKFTWSKVLSTQFYAYKLQRKASTDIEEDYETIFSTTCNQTTTYIIPAEELTSGFWNYRIVLLNRNMIKTYFNEIEVELV